ncbi:MAG: response regulator, partial [Alphaproteobacteria bacterium]|nr:response regulator [Alphaproteobacteria bacterium]
MAPRFMGIFRRSVGALHVLFAASLLVPAILFALAAWQNRTILFGEAGQRTVKTAAILEQQAAATMQVYEMVFLRVEDYLRSHEQHLDPVELHQFLHQLDKDSGATDAVFVMDADGGVIAHSRFPPPLAINAADRDYFMALRDHGDRISIGAPIAGRLSGERRINIAHPLHSADGRFAGAVVISVSESYFGQFYRTVRDTPTDEMRLIRVDGVVLARSPPLPENDTAGPARQSRLALAAIDGGGVARLTSRIDGVDRLYAFRNVDTYPLYVSYGLDTADVLARWHANLFAYSTIALPAVLLLLLAVRIALHRARQEAAALSRLRAESEQRAASEARREEAEAALRQAQKMEAIGQMTGGVAHDFNNLLTVIIGNLDMIASSNAWPESVRKQLTTALKAAQRGGTLTQQLLAFARRQLLRPEIVNPNRLIEDFVQLIRQAAGEAVEVQIILSPTLDPCRIDRAQFEAAILNLVVNARDAMPGGGKITLETRNLEATAEDVAGSPEFVPGPYVVVSVSDTGEGMAPEVLEKAFDPFFTTKEVGRGSGLGLSMVYGFVKQSGGHVTIDSERGVGTEVKIYLPRSGGTHREAAGAMPGDEEEAPRGSEAILLVEDNEEVLKLAVGMVEQLGYEVAVARDAGQALAILETDQPVDAIFTDIVMPGGMAGDQLASKALELRPGIKVLLTSGYAAQSSGIGATLVGGFPMITKPYRRTELAIKLRE